MNKASELFLKAAKKCCPHYGNDTGLDKLLATIAKAMDKLEQFEEKRAKLRKDREDADAKYQHALDVIRMQEKQLQRECDHDFHRGTAECDSICRHCGADESDVTPLPQEAS